MINEHIITESNGVNTPCFPSITKITSTGTLTKTYALSNTGELLPITSAHMTAGYHEQIRLSSAAQFADLLEGLDHNQALAYGIAPVERRNILSTKKWHAVGQPADTLCRTNKWFSWPAGPGVLMLDFDFHGVSRNGEETIRLITDALPELQSTAYIWWSSSSSYIYNGDIEVNGLRGQRLYIFVKDATDIPRAGQVLFDRLWLAGLGFYEVSKAGSLLQRCVIDGSVWQPSRLDFASGADCIAPLRQQRPAPKVHKGSFLDTRLALPNLSCAEKKELEALQLNVKKTMHEQADVTRSQYIETRVRADLREKNIVNPTDDDVNAATRTINRALNANTLTGDFLITLENGSTLEVDEALDNPKKYHLITTKDPIEVDYDGGRTVGILYLLNGRPTLYSQAHGGKSYRLVRQPKLLEHIKGRSAATVDNTLSLLRELPDIYDMGEQLVMIDGEGIRPLTIELLPYILGSVIQYWTWNKNNSEAVKVEIDPPKQILSIIIALGAHRQLKQLKAIITAPIITADDHVINHGGYDKSTQLYLAVDDTLPTVLESVNTDQALAALNKLMYPFDTFPFADKIDRSVCLSAALTALTRAVVGTSPAFAIDAPKQGTGKTYLAECLGLLATGKKPAALPPIDSRNDDEIRKRLFAELMGGARTILWDNVTGTFNSASLAAFLTAEVFSDRVLSKSETRELPNRALFLITGNNLHLAGELPRRVLTCRLDSGKENPTLRSFQFNPIAYITRHRQELVQAGLTLIRGYLQSEAHQLGGVKSDRLASFETWDTLARQVVAWVATFDSRYTDPKQSIDVGVGVDPEQEILSTLLTGLQTRFKEQWFTAKDVSRFIDTIGFGQTGQRSDHDLRDVFEDLLKANNFQKINSLQIGRVLSYRRDRIADGLKLTLWQQGKKAAMYRVDIVAE